MKEKKKFKINFHLVFIIGLLIIIGVVVFRLDAWNKRSQKVDLSDIEEGQFDLECLDYYIYPEENNSDGHVVDGVEDIVILGNFLANNFGYDHSVINIMREKMDANIIDLSVDNSKIASNEVNISYGLDSFSLYHLVSSIVKKDFTYQQVTEWSEGFRLEEDYNKVMDNLYNTDFTQVDTVLILYSLHDYYSCVPTLFADEQNVFGYHGALYSSIKLLQDTYPHLNIILASPIPVYLSDAEGNIALGTVTDYGMGNASIYINHQYAVATQLCVSFIDNYFYKINESNITEYSNGQTPNDAGIDVVGDHIVQFITKKGIGIN